MISQTVFLRAPGSKEVILGMTEVVSGKGEAQAFQTHQCHEAPHTGHKSMTVLGKGFISNFLKLYSFFDSIFICIFPPTGKGYECKMSKYNGDH